MHAIGNIQMNIEAKKIDEKKFFNSVNFVFFSITVKRSYAELYINCNKNISLSIFSFIWTTN